MVAAAIAHALPGKGTFFDGLYRKVVIAVHGPLMALAKLATRAASRRPGCSITAAGRLFCALRRPAFVHHV